MPLKDAVPVRISIEQEELRGISRTVAEIHWLLLILVLLYLIFSGARDDAEASAAISAGLFFYAALVVSFRYANFYRRETRWKIAIESCAMIAFITWVLWHTDRLSSPLLNAYLLPVIAAALTLGKLTTLVEIGLIAACYIFLGGTESGGLGSLRFTAAFAAQLANIRGFAVAANRLFAQAQRHGRASSVLMIDSDNLKGVNDAYGHAAGNRLLRQLAAATQAELRFTDVAARYGGDEFIVLLPETPGQGAMDVAERIRNRVAGTPLELDGKRVVSSVSIGIACFPEDGGTLDALAAHADRALYVAKQDGRNRTVRFRAAA